MFYIFFKTRILYDLLLNTICLRHKWNKASHAFMWDKKAFPKPWPSAAPFTNPAMSTTFKNAGTLLKNKQKKKSIYNRWVYNNNIKSGP